MPKNTTFIPVDPGVRIGHVHLKVADLDRSLAFYQGLSRSVGAFAFRLFSAACPQLHGPGYKGSRIAAL